MYSGSGQNPVINILASVIVANHTILSKICNGYNQFCQVVGQDFGQSAGWVGGFRERLKIEA